MSMTMDFYEVMADRVLSRLERTMKESGDIEVYLSKDQLLAVYQVAATLTLAQLVEYLRDAD